MTDQPAFGCQICHGPTVWRLLRVGDSAITWSCPSHLHETLTVLQRSHEQTEVTVSARGASS